MHHTVYEMNISAHIHLQAGMPDMPSSQKAAMLGPCMVHSAQSRSSQLPVAVAGLSGASQPVPQHATSNEADQDNPKCFIET